jgi:N-acetylglucosaminyldiphosphoundecaprenol N-acetyl-beta-D-mannosaminyltransferase
LLGVDVDAVSNADAIAYIVEHAKAGQPAAYVVKPYVEFLDQAATNPELRSLLNNAELAIPDGISLTWAAAYLYAGKRSAARFWLTLLQIVLAPRELRWPLPDRAAGINFTWPLLSSAESAGLKVFLVGNPRGSSIEQTGRTLLQAFPQLKLAGTRSGLDPTQPYGQVSEAWMAELAEAIESSGADLVLIGMGFPLQERVCAYLAAHLKHGVLVGEGGTFDYERFGGHRPKAPAPVQRIGLEWLWRLGLEPKRIVRQTAIPRFIYRIWRSR